MPDPAPVMMAILPSSSWVSGRPLRWVSIHSAAATGAGHWFRCRPRAGPRSGQPQRHHPGHDHQGADHPPGGEPFPSSATPSSTPNSTEVSRRADTVATGARVMAHSAMP